MNKPSKKKAPDNQIASNKKAGTITILKNGFEAGLALEGWEIKSLRAGRVQLKESYVLLKDGEAWVIGAHISPLSNVPDYIHPDPLRTRKLLLHRRELAKLFAAKDRQGYTIVVLDLHWKGNKIKASIATAKGKKEYDKRDTAKKRDWEREKQRLLKR